MKQNVMKVGFAMLLCGVMSLGAMGCAYAATGSDVVSGATPAAGMQQGQMKQRGGPNLDSLVAAGTITQVQKDAIDTAMKAGRESQKKIDAILAELVTAGTITQSQSDAVLKAMTPNGTAPDAGGQGKSPLAALVTAGTITQEQCDAIEAAMKPSGATKTAPGDALTALVTAGTITEAQKTAVESAMKRPDAGQQSQQPGNASGAAAVPAEKSSSAGIAVSINGKAVSGTVAPYVDQNSRTMIELRSVAEALGAELAWDSETQTVTLTANGNVVKIKINQPQYSVNGSAKTMDTAAVIKGGRTMVPVRVVSEALGSTVSYDSATKTVLITQ